MFFPLRTGVSLSDTTPVSSPESAGVGLFTDGGDGSFYGVNSQAIFKIKKDGTGYTIVREFEGRDLQTGA